jgi:membrane glycosyltransferase
VVALLLLPKVLILTKALFHRAAPQFGGDVRLVASVLCEIVMTTLIAPMMLLLQVRAVAQILSGRDGGWPVNPRGAGNVSLTLALRATWWIVLAGIAALALAFYLAPEVVVWTTPVALPMILAPALVSWTSRRSRGTLFHVPRELEVGGVVTCARYFQAAWNDPAQTAESPVA